VCGVMALFLRSGYLFAVRAPNDLVRATGLFFFLLVFFFFAGVACCSPLEGETGASGLTATVFRLLLKSLVLSGDGSREARLSASGRPTAASERTAAAFIPRLDPKNRLDCRVDLFDCGEGK